MQFDKNYPLHNAINEAHLDRVGALIKQGYDVNQEDNGLWYTPLYLLVLCYRHKLSLRKNLINIASLLLKAGADPNRGIYNALYFAGKYGHVQLIELFLSYQADPNLYYGNFTPLITAIREGHHDVVRLLLTQADPIQPDKCLEKPPLQHALEAIFYDDKSILSIRYLLSHPRMHSTHQNSRQTSLVMESMLGTCILQLLAYRSNVNLYLKQQSKTIQIIQAFILGGFPLRQEIAYYCKLEIEQLNCMTIFDSAQDREELEKIKKIYPELYLTLCNKETLSHIMQQEVFPFMTAAIEAAEKLQVAEKKQTRQYKRCSNHQTVCFSFCTRKKSVYFSDKMERQIFRECKPE